VKWRGRSLVALALLAFLIVAGLVVWRRTVGVAESREIAAMQKRVVELEAQRARLEGDIRDLSSRGRLAPLVERRLGMHVPNDTQVVILPREGVAR
jgi:type II secretory pathway pseudopilin PulG